MKQQQKFVLMRRYTAEWLNTQRKRKKKNCRNQVVSRESKRTAGKVRRSWHFGWRGLHVDDDCRHETSLSKVIATIDKLFVYSSSSTIHTAKKKKKKWNAKMMKRKKKIKSRKKNKIKLLTWQNAIVGDATGSPPFTVWPSFSLRKVPTREDILALGFPHLRLFAHGGHTHREPHSFLRQFQNRKEKKSSEFKEREGKRKKIKIKIKGTPSHYKMQISEHFIIRPEKKPLTAKVTFD